MGLTKQGKPCGGTPTTSSGQKWCPGHDPRFSPEQRKAWRQRGALSLHHKRLLKESAAVAQQVVAVAPTLPPDVPLPPVPNPEAPDWSDARKIRVYLQDLAVQVAAGKIAVSVAEMLRKLAESVLKVIDIEIDALIAEKVEQRLAAGVQGGGMDVIVEKPS